MLISLLCKKKEMTGRKIIASRLLIIVPAFVTLLLLNNSNSIAQEVKVLFLGNSYTAVNNLPSLVSGLAFAGGHDIYTDRNTPGGYTLAFPSFGHLYNQLSLSKINEEDWDYVVLQEQSQYPVIDYYRDNFTFPGAVKLDSIIKQNNECTKTIFYMTWGRKFGGEQCINGHCSVPFSNYAHMQDSLASTYLSISNYLQTPVCPAGLSWKKSIVQNGDPVELFSGDGSHPSLAGSYLTACTFYATIFQESPIGLSFTGGLDETVAEYLQTVASETVLDNLELWNIDTTTVVSGFSYIQNGGEISFDNLSVNADGFIWNFGNGDSDTTASPVYSYHESGSYEVSLIAYSGCKADTTTETIQVVISGEEIISEKISLLIYPVPAKDEVVIEYEFDNSNTVFNMVVIDVGGTIHRKFILKSDCTKIVTNLSSLARGTYFVNIISDMGRIVESRPIILE